MDKTKWKVIKKEGFKYVCEELESGKEVKLSLSPKCNVKALTIGAEYMFSVNQDWINRADSLTPDVADTPNDNLNKYTKPVKKEKKEYNLEEIFNTLNSITCNIEKKGNYSYVSWTDAWSEVMKVYPGTKFKVYENSEGFPVFTMKGVGSFVKVGVTINNIEHIEHYPVLNFSNAAIKEDKLNVFDINKSIKRCMVKALAYFGLGLYVYKGEDLPEE